MPSGDRLCATLGLIHPLTRTTCIGYGTRKPDCGCAVALASRQAAHALLLEIKDDLDQQLDVAISLRQLASLLLCKRWHQYQADENVRRWKTSLRDYASSNRRTNEHTTTTRSGGPPSHAPKTEILRSTSNRRLLKELRRRIEKLDDLDLAAQIIELADELRDSESESESESDDDDDDDNDDVEEDAEDSGDESEGHNKEEDRSETEPHASTQRLPSRPGRSSRGQQQHRGVNDSDTTRSLRRSPPAAPLPPLRQSHIECAVCLLPYTDDSADHWQCARCLNRVHQGCFDSWSASLLGEQTVRCIHCRAEV